MGKMGGGSIGGPHSVDRAWQKMLEMSFNV